MTLTLGGLTGRAVASWDSFRTSDGSAAREVDVVGSSGGSCWASYGMVCILVEHVGEDILGVLQAFDHLQVGALHGCVERIRIALPTLVDVGDYLGLAAQHDFSVVLEVDLHHLVGEAEHDGMAGAHPLLHVHDVSQSRLFRFWRNCLLLSLGLFAALEVTAEMLEECDLLLQVLGILVESVLVSEVLAINCAAFNIVEVVVVRVEYYFSRVIEEHASGIVAEVVSESVLGGIVHPLSHPDFVLLQVLSRSS